MSRICYTCNSLHIQYVTKLVVTYCIHIDNWSNTVSSVITGWK